MTTSTPDNILSYQSFASFIFDVPEPEGIEGEFVYNYFLPNEMVSINSHGTEESFAKHRNLYAREIKLRFSTLNSVVPAEADITELFLSDEEKKKILQYNQKKIIKETDFLHKSFVSLK